MALTLYALDTVINRPTGITKSELLREMEGHVLEKVQLTGCYHR